MRLPTLPGYEYLELLDEDPFGWSFVANYQGREKRVIKVFKAQATSDQFIYSYLKRFSKPGFGIEGVAKVHDYVFQNRENLTAYTTPFFGWRGSSSGKWQRSSLKLLMRVVESDQALDLVRDLASVLSAVHAENLFYGGLRPSEIYLTGDTQSGHEIQLSEFGQIFMGGLHYLEVDDLLFYTSPEQLMTGDFSGGQGKQWDVYAFGVIAFQLLTGHLPRLDHLCQKSVEKPELFRNATAISYGQLTEVSEHFLEQLELEKSVEWPTVAVDLREKDLRRIIEDCLSFEASARPASMMEVTSSIEAVWKSLESPVPRAESVPPAVEKVVSSTRVPVPAELPAPVVENALDVELEPDVKAPELEPIEENFVSVPETETGLALVEPALGEVVPAFAPEWEPTSIRTFFSDVVHRPIVRWQAIAVIALIAILPLSYFAFFNYYRFKGAEEELSMEAAALQADVEKQASVYKRELLDKQRNTTQLQSELNEVEDSRSQLVGEAKLARQIVRQTQENGDQFFKLVLENRDTDVPGFREHRADALIEGRRHYERLIEVYGDAPDFIVSTANALFYLGQIYREMGEFGKALAVYGEAERRYTALLEDSSTSNIEFVRNIAIAKQSLGELSIKAGEYSIARHYFTESSRFWGEVRAMDGSWAKTAAIRIHENSLAIVESEFAMERFEPALDAALSVGVQIAKLMEDDPEDHEAVGALARSFALAGGVFEAMGRMGDAEKSFQQSSDLYAKAVELNSTVDAYHLGLGNSLARTGLISNDQTKLKGAAEVLAGVVASNPYESNYLKTLADIYGVLAENQRDGGKLDNAVELEREALVILKPIVNNEAVAPDVLFSYSERLSHLAELLGDIGKFDASRVPLREAITILEKVTQSDKSLASHHRSLARARGLAGFACIKSGDKSGAKEHLQLAKAGWDSYMQSNPDDPDAAQAAKWTSEQLSGL
ncbi:tetratricopeptide repeat-containing serine/threonine-protein kinase [Verrucomicrobiales bacterium]|nr:tetratricopeptide repeat-containing serine/threonine-protein kinase [Verrucomicrobiales bacterium]